MGASPVWWPPSIAPGCCSVKAEPLPVAFYERPTTVVARDLIGKVIERRWPAAPPTRARIVEVEAYLGEGDAASHARRGPTKRAAIMFGPPGRLYVYLIYGIHHCMNFVAKPSGTAGAVLIRSAALLAPGSDPRALAGPGKLCAGLGINLSHKGLDLTAGELVVVDDGATPPRIASSARIGVDYAGPWARRRLRFYVPAHPAVSVKRPSSARPLRG
jgi:DNA-3-methyladenine glycosylase